MRPDESQPPASFSGLLLLPVLLAPSFAHLEHSLHSSSFLFPSSSTKPSEFIDYRPPFRISRQPSVVNPVTPFSSFFFSYSFHSPPTDRFSSPFSPRFHDFLPRPPPTKVDERQRKQTTRIPPPLLSRPPISLVDAQVAIEPILRCRLLILQSQSEPSIPPSLSFSLSSDPRPPFPLSTLGLPPRLDRPSSLCHLTAPLTPRRL